MSRDPVRILSNPKFPIYYLMRKNYNRLKNERESTVYDIQQHL